MSRRPSKILSWNVKGINGSIKRKKIYGALRRAGCLLALLQETHLDAGESAKLAREGFNAVVASPAVNKKNEGAILMHSTLDYKILKMWTRRVDERRSC